MLCLKCVIDSSVRVFIREVNSLRLLIINGAIPVIIISTYRALIDVFTGYVNQVLPLSSYNVKPMLTNSVSFINNIMWFITAASLTVSLVTSVFIISGLIRDWHDELRAIHSMYRARAGVFIHVLIILALATLYSYVIGISISVALTLIVLKALSSLGIMPLINYSVGILNIAYSSLPLLPLLLITYSLIGVVRVLKHGFIP